MLGRAICWKIVERNQNVFAGFCSILLAVLHYERKKNTKGNHGIMLAV
jgi:hypothetical protein